MHRLELHLNVQLLKDSVIEEQHNKDLLGQTEVMKKAFYDGCEDYFFLLNNQFEIVSFNTSAVSFFNKRNNGLTLQQGKKLSEYLLPSNVYKVERFLQKAQEGETNSF